MLILSVLSSLMVSSAQAVPPRNNPRIDDQFAELDEELVLRFFDAVTGNPLSNAQVTFEGKRSRTDNLGAARFTMPDDLPAGDYKSKVSVVKEGYITAEIPLTFMAGSLWHNQFSLSPKLKSEKFRIVVDWGEKPRDLDAHLLKKNMDNQDVYHISFHHMKRH